MEETEERCHSLMIGPGCHVPDEYETVIARDQELRARLPCERERDTAVSVTSNLKKRPRIGSPVRDRSVPSHTRRLYNVVPVHFFSTIRQPSI